MKDYPFIVQFLHKGRWWVTAQAADITAAELFIARSKKKFDYEYRVITFEQYEKEKNELTNKRLAGILPT